MKKIIGLFLFVFLVAGLQNVSAQKELKEGNITIGITDLQVDDPSVAPQLQMIKTATMNIAFTKDQSLITGDVMGGMMKMQVLYKSNPKDMLMLIDAMGQKMMTELKADDFTEMEKKAKDAQEKAKDEEFDYDVTYDKKDKKKISGYNCYKANIVINNKEAKENNLKIALYVTDAIKYPASMLESMKSSGAPELKLKEMPLEITISGGEKGKGGSITLAATKIEKKVDKSVFKLNTDGYEKMDMDELQKMGGGM
ncbi:MAG: hypothetical protein AB8F94_23400 [Saprospiraceae bacterium]